MNYFTNSKKAQFSNYNSVCGIIQSSNQSILSYTKNYRVSLFGTVIHKAEQKK